MKTPRILRKRASERGAILVTAIMVIVVMLLMATPFLVKLSAGNRSTERAARALMAFNLAEAGIDRALWEMNQPYLVPGGIVVLDAEGNGTIVPTDEVVGDRIGTIQGTITTNLGVEPNVRTILSTGGIPHIAGQPVTRTVSVNLQKYYKSIWDLGIFGDEGINYDGIASKNITFDSYDHTRPGYSGNMGDAGTNSDSTNAIWLKGKIYGDVAAGAGTALGNEGNVVNITGLQEGNVIKTLSSEYLLPPVDVYNLPPKDMFETSYDFSTWFNTPPPVDGPLSASMISTGYNKGTYSTIGVKTLTSAQSGVYTGFNLGKTGRADITIQGDVAMYITGLDGSPATLGAKNNINFTIPEGSSLTLILGSADVNLRNNIQINNSGAPENLVILGTSQFTGEFSLRNNIPIKAAIYIPSAEFTMRDNVQLYGAIIANYITMRNNNEIHYDEALKNLDYIKGGIAYWKLTSWREQIGN